jgi:glycerophosphoryl diester phosphodiesterase
VKRAGLLLIPYTVNDPKVFFRLTDGGADGVFTNCADVLRAAWRERSRKRLP